MDGHLCLDAALLTSFVFDEHVHFFVLCHFKGFVLDVFGLVRSHTSVRLGDKRAGYVAPIGVTRAFADIVFWDHDYDAKNNSVVLLGLHNFHGRVLVKATVTDKPAYGPVPVFGEVWQ